jgi:predicted metal-binding membrane protein
VRHERAFLACTIVLLSALCWGFLLGGMPMGSMAPQLTDLVAMWSLMMLAMMLPSASPAILLYARVRDMRGRDVAVAPPWIFFCGYLVAWLLFSIAAALAQSILTDSSMALRNHGGRSAILLRAGLYQLSPIKSACLNKCRSPAQFISRHWRSGWQGAVRLGILHGTYCVGCCWMLMALLFVGGVMSLVWVVGLTVLVATEKLLPMGLWIQKISGVVLILWSVREALA